MNIFRKMFRIERKENYKVFHILGFKIKHKSKYKKMVSRLEHAINQLQQKVDAQERMLALIDEEKLKILMQARVDIMAKHARSLVMPHINRDYVSSLVENMKGIGIKPRETGPKLIVSLTSYPKRMYDIHLTLYSLLTQTTKPDKVILWLADEQFPNHEGDIPKKVLGLCQYGLEIRWCPDYKSHKKLVPALQAFPNDVIVTADDDLYYAPEWLEKLWNKYKELGKGVIAHRGHKMKIIDNKLQPYTSWQFSVRTGDTSYLNFQTNGGGTLYSPGSLHPDVHDMAKAMEVCPHADDVWFWGMTVLAGTKIHVLENRNTIVYVNTIREVGLNQDGTLYSSNKVGGNDSQIESLFKSYPEIWQRVLQEHLETTENSTATA